MLASRRGLLLVLGTLLVALTSPSCLARQVISVTSVGAVADGRTDNTGAFQRALDSCKDVYLPPGTYLLAARVYLCPGGNQKVFGAGPTSVILISPNWSTRDPWGVFVNAGYASPTIADADIEFADLKFDASAFKDGNLHAVHLRSVRDVYAHGLICVDLGDCTAFLHSENTLVADSTATGSLNAGFDHWDNPAGAEVVNTTTYCAGSSYGILFNASPDGLADGVGKDFTAVANKEYGCQLAGIFVAPLTTGGQITGVNITDNLADGLNGPGSAIAIHGNVKDGQIVDTIAQNINGGCAICIFPNGGPAPGNFTVISPVSRNVSVPPTDNLAVLGLYGDGHMLINPEFFGNNSFPFAVAITSSGPTFIEGDLPSGTVGEIDNLGAGAPVVFHGGTLATSVRSLSLGIR